MLHIKSQSTSTEYFEALITANLTLTLLIHFQRYLAHKMMRAGNPVLRFFVTRDKGLKKKTPKNLPHGNKEFEYSNNSNPDLRVQLDADGIQTHHAGQVLR